MNRIFKTVWNVARRALVVVNEKTGIGQSRCAVGRGKLVKRIAEPRVSSNQKRRFGVPSRLAMALAGVFALLTGNPETVRAHHTFRTLWNAVRGQLVAFC